MSRLIDYTPHKTVGDKRYHLLSLHVAIDFGGRQFQCEFQSEPDRNGDTELIDATYYPIGRKWSNENWGTTDDLSESLHTLWVKFDTTGVLTGEGKN